MKTIQHTKPTLGDMEAIIARKVILSGFVNDSIQGEKLCSKLSIMCKMAGGITTSTGTHALVLALKAIGIENKKDEVIIPDFSCRAVYDAVKMSGGTPVFCDIGHDYTLSSDSVSKAIGKNTKAIILIHMFGQAADYFAFDNFGISVIEDCAQSPGAKISGKHVGSLGRFSIFSLEGSKFIGGGEGGVVLTKTNNDLETLKEKKMHGELAYQCRLSDIIASIGIVQLKRLGSFIQRRQKIANYYSGKLKRLEDAGKLVLPPRINVRENIFYRFVILVDNERRDELIKFAREKGIILMHPIKSGCLSLYLPGIKKYKLGFAEEVDKKIISIPIYPSLTLDERKKVVDVIVTFFQNRHS